MKAAIQMNLNLEEVIAWCRREGVMLAIAPMTGYLFADDKRVDVEEIERRVMGAKPAAPAFIAGELSHGVGAHILHAEGYESLGDVLHRAFDQAANGKGKERHAGEGEPFDAQVMQDMARRFGVGSLLGQAFKKSEESQRLPLAASTRELLGAINYIAGAIIHQEKKHSAQAVATDADVAGVTVKTSMTPIDRALSSQDQVRAYKLTAGLAHG